MKREIVAFALGWICGSSRLLVHVFYIGLIVVLYVLHYIPAPFTR